MRDAGATGPHNEIDIFTRRKPGVFGPETQTAGFAGARTHKSSLIATRCPICADSGPNSASQRNDAKCQLKHRIGQLYLRLASWAVFTVRNGLDHPI